MTTTTRPARLNFTNAWTALPTLTWDQLALLLDRIDSGLEGDASNALWLGRWERVTDEMVRRGVTAVKYPGGRWMVGYPEMFAPIV